MFQMQHSLNTSRITARLEIRAADDEHTYATGLFFGNTISLPSARETKSLKFETDYTVFASFALPREPHNGGYVPRRGACPVLYFR